MEAQTDLFFCFVIYIIVKKKHQKLNKCRAGLGSIHWLLIL